MVKLESAENKAGSLDIEVRFYYYYSSGYLLWVFMRRTPPENGHKNLAPAIRRPFPVP